ncbi:hypothetical protein D3C78_1125450 [compost metagenome]
MLHSLNVASGDVRQINVSNGVRSCSYCSLHITAGANFLIVLFFLNDVTTAKCFCLIINTSTGTKRTGNDYDIFIFTANIFPVRNFTGVNSFKLLSSQVIYFNALVYNRRKRDNRYFVSNLARKSFKSRYIDARIPVTCTNISNSFFNSLWTCNGAFTGSSNFHLRMELLEFFRSLKRKRQQCRRAVNCNFPLQIIFCHGWCCDR